MSGHVTVVQDNGGKLKKGELLRSLADCTDKPIRCSRERHTFPQSRRARKGPNLRACQDLTLECSGCGFDRSCPYSEERPPIDAVARVLALVPFAELWARPCARGLKTSNSFVGVKPLHRLLG